MFYFQVAERSHGFGRGLRSRGQAPGSAIAMYAETRAEWMISCLGAFSQNIHVCTGQIDHTLNSNTGHFKLNTDR